MSRDYLSQLREQRDQVADRKATVDQESRSLEAKLQEIDKAIDSLTSALDAAKRAVEVEEGPKRVQARVRNALSPADISGHAKRLLLENGRPLKRGPLLKLFDIKGIPIAGGDRAKVLGTIIWRARDENGNPQFVNTDAGYWPRGVDVPKR